MAKLIVSVSQNAVVQAESAILGCDQCTSAANVPFSQILEALRVSADPADTIYIIPVLATCPKCRSSVDETTLILPKHRFRSAAHPETSRNEAV